MTGSAKKRPSDCYEVFKISDGKPVRYFERDWEALEYAIEKGDDYDWDWIDN